MPLFERFRSGGWSAVALYLGIALVTLVVLIEVLKKSNATHLTIGALLVMLLYVVVGAFLVLASRLFVSSPPPRTRE